MSDPPAMNLRAIRARLEPKLRTVGYVVIDHEDFRAIVAAYDAQAARLAVAESVCDAAECFVKWDGKSWLRKGLPLRQALGAAVGVWQRHKNG